MKEYFSHTGKRLEIHLQRVAEKTRNRTHLKIAEIAALFHDLGKVNHNFQRKLKGEKDVGYSSHAYLSTLAWLCFFETNKSLAKEILDGDASLKYSVAVMIARHHGNLPNMNAGFLNCDECERLRKFILEVSAEDVQISEFLQSFYPHNNFPTKVEDNALTKFLDDFPLAFNKKYLEEKSPSKIADKLNFYLNTQFGFACLIESDKRDAGNNTVFKNKDLSKDFQDKFSTNLDIKLQEIAKISAEEIDEKKKRLDTVRSQMRKEALANLRKFLDEDREQRVFTLPAPTGAGKTFMLLSLANEILKHREDLSVIYALPFLAITEQTENICLDILQDDEKVLRVDSKSENKEIEKLQRILDDNPSDENVKKLLQQLFSNETFDHPFIITTFVQVFETLVSNRNATLLRLPNFSKTIFLLDEIQALPPSLYTFFVAYLDEFCRKFDSYAIVSTATMPHLKLPNETHYKEREKPSKVFTRYKEPKKILDERFYKFDEFNRYKIIPKFEVESIRDLAEEIKRQKESCLIVLNTIKDTKNLYKELNGDYESQTEESEYILLNTHFTLEDRQRKLAICQKRLKNKQKVVLISTQLVEAGVDIDFPVVYRDLCPLPNLIQTAGRCNRNYKLDFGEVYFFELKDDKGQSSAKKIYGRNFDWFLKFTRKAISSEIYEKNMLAIQDDFAKTQISDALPFGVYAFGSDKEINLVECINQIRFEDFAKVRLIDADYGVQLRIYISRSDGQFDELRKLFDKGKLIAPRDFTKIRLHRSDVDKQLRKMSKKTVSVRIAENQLSNLNHLINEDEKLFEIYLTNAESKYSPIEGLKIEFEGGEVI
jgi:CRISPR-associated endonuclease/helicase Cas3